MEEFDASVVNEGREVAEADWMREPDEDEPLNQSDCSTKSGSCSVSLKSSFNCSSGVEGGQVFEPAATIEEEEKEEELEDGEVESEAPGGEDGEMEAEALGGEVEPVHVAPGGEDGEMEAEALGGEVEAVHVATAILARNPSAESSSREPNYVSDSEPVLGEAIYFSRTAPTRGGSKYPFFTYDGFTYSVNKPEKKLEKEKAKQRWVLRCINYTSAKCTNKVTLDGNDKLFSLSLPVHVCCDRKGRDVKKRLQEKIRELVDAAMAQGKLYQFQLEVSNAFRSFSDEDIKASGYTLPEANKYAYDHSRYKNPLPKAPTDIHFSWPENSDFLLRDLGHTGEKSSIVLHDSEVFQYVSARGVEKEGRFVVYGDPFVKNFSQFADGLLYDGTYYSAPRAFGQLFNIMMRIVVAKDSEGKPVKVAYVNVVSVLMSGHDYELYFRLFTWVKQWLGEWQPKYSMSDFEKAATCAFRKVWAMELARLGCKFHLSHAQRAWMTRQGFLKAVMEECQSRRQIRFVLALAYIPVEFVPEVAVKFLELVKGQQQKTVFVNTVLGYMQQTWLGFPREGKEKGWKQGRYKLDTWNRHEATKNGWPTTNNVLEVHHSVLKRHTGPSPGLWSFSDLMGLMFELNRGRLRKLDQIIEARLTETEAETCLDAYDVDVEEAKELGFDLEAVEEISERSPQKDGGRALKDNLSHRWIRGVSESSVRRLKENPLSSRYVQSKLGAEVSVRSGYHSMELSRVGMEEPFESLEEGVRSWPAYCESSDLRYLFCRKMACLMDGFGRPKPFAMTTAEKVVFARHSAQWDPVGVMFDVSEDEDAVLSDNADVVENCEQEQATAKRRESISTGVLKVSEEKGHAEEKVKAKKKTKRQVKGFGKKGDQKTDFSAMSSAEVAAVKGRRSAALESDSDDDAPLSVFSPPPNKRRSDGGETSKAGEKNAAAKKSDAENAKPETEKEEPKKKKRVSKYYSPKNLRSRAAKK